ncbi:hypothetical protein [Azospirillum lipoferum]|uniref:Uncharacterized protein n=1 Tax=Azospirillum lipoferum (strain 4B) TaxID=862719 RepID=G7ZCD6_AZOL4|nr:hypothetical protein [Azospirillum lipoferum]CBS89276.1 protein of unknown function [Azospirillum lipoferum 4B]
MTTERQGKKIEPPLVGADKDDEKDQRADRPSWRREAIHLSPICLVAIVRPLRRDLETAQSEMKRELYRYLRRLSQTLLDYGVARPVVCLVIAADKEERGLLDRWGADQGWHRGAFALYAEVEEKRVELRLKDLLSPEVEELMTEDAKQQTLEQYLAKIMEEQARTGVSGPDASLLEVIRSVVQGATRNENPNIRDIIGGWVGDQVEAARRMVEESRR